MRNYFQSRSLRGSVTRGRGSQRHRLSCMSRSGAMLRTYSITNLESRILERHLRCPQVRRIRCWLEHRHHCLTYLLQQLQISPYLPANSLAKNKLPSLIIVILNLDKLFTLTSKSQSNSKFLAKTKTRLILAKRTYKFNRNPELQFPLSNNSSMTTREHQVTKLLLAQA